MSYVIGVLIAVLVLDCLLLVLLVLIQLPKKDAGAGVAFGGAATDALFGAGSGNVLTKTTKYAAVVFFVLCIVLSVMQSHRYHRGKTELREQMEQQGKQPPVVPAPAARESAPAPAVPAPVTAPTPTTSTGVNLLLSAPPATATNAPPASPQP